jgi:hypothetical protein
LGNFLEEPRLHLVEPRKRLLPLLRAEQHYLLPVQPTSQRHLQRQVQLRLQFVGSACPAFRRLQFLRL